MTDKIKQALEALVQLAEKHIYPQPDKPDSDWQVLQNAKSALASLSAAQQQEPSYYVCVTGHSTRFRDHLDGVESEFRNMWTPLYTSPQPTRNEVLEMLVTAWKCGYYEAGYTHDSAFADKKSLACANEILNWGKDELAI